MIVFVAFFLKILAIAGAARFLNERLRDRLGAWLAAWVFIEALTIALMLAVSPFNALTPLSVWTWLVVLALLFPASIFRLGWHLRDAASILGRVEPSFAVFGLVLIVFAARSLVMWDYTHDAAAYGYPRLAIWMNYGSLLVHMPTPQINIFTNEWNGELNALLYGVSSRSLQGLNFGGVEVLGLTFASSCWLARRLGANQGVAAGAALVITVTPAVLGLSVTVKGDLLACAALIMAASFMTLMRDQDRWPQAGAFAIASLGLAIGSKVSSASFAVFFAIAVMIAMVPRWRDWRAIASVALGGLMAAVFCARYFINIAMYGDPLNRAGGEAAEPGLRTFLENMQVIGTRVFGFFPDAPPHGTWALSGGLGATGALAAAWLAVWVIKRGEPAPRVALILLAISVMGMTAAAYVIPARPWSFRYFLPFLCVSIVILFSCARAGWSARASLLLPIAAIVNLASVIPPGEIFPRYPHLRLADHLSGYFNLRPIERALRFHVGTYKLFGVGRLGLDVRDGKKIVVYNTINTFILPFVGSRAQNRLFLTETPDQLREAVTRHAPDIIVMTRLSPALDSLEQAVVSDPHYAWANGGAATPISDGFFRIGQRR